MNDVKIFSRTIGTSVIAETARIESLRAKVEIHEGAEKQLLENLLRISEQMRNSESQQKQLADQIATAVARMVDEKDEQKRKGIVIELFDGLKASFGRIVDIVDTVAKLRGLFGE